MMLDPLTDLHALFARIVDCESVSGQEEALAGLVESALGGLPHLETVRIGNNVVARTRLGRPDRVLVAGHLDTVPVADNLPSVREVREDGEYLVGRGSCDMKGGVAVALALAAQLERPAKDVTWVFYDCEEIAARYNGLGRIASERPDLLDADLAILMEPTDGVVEGGCQGTMRFTLTVPGAAAHSARSWTGHNAIHDLAPILEILRRWQDRDPLVEVDGLTYHEGLNATMVSAGLAGNVIPPEATIQINYRYAPDKSAAQAQEAMRRLFDGWEMEVLDLSSPARPGLDRPLAQSFVARVGTEPRPKYGWTDVARFSELGTPALNFGPGDPLCAHKADECCRLASLDECRDALGGWLSGESA
ncbi:succinyl-diaminopimelate desuccinylase [Acidipropionibacterium virtanenii]|uniref:Succinyl-diaminopimelate desuccinylase n=1 Tax=Acidipropionibacterium virtanenii TaxID=2057246 RepID=A0A344UVL4_9ACTN|nr:succinyl-diaminopimelate desuccinylase [Acidipropionibacterium virtanenii]AXE39312.1 Putative succinyl-diaminopimelate desuccinylase DapE [Acidipropionibacterium virtanenii]